MTLKKPPYSLDAEQAVLGGAMLSPAAWGLVCHKLRPAHFFREDHRRIAEAIDGLFRANRRIDPVTVSEAMGDSELMGYLGDLFRSTPGAFNVEAYADIVVDRHIRRTVMGVNVWQIAEDAASGLESISAIRTRLDAIAGEFSPQEASGGLERYVEVMRERSRLGGALLGQETGFDVLDERWFGLCEPDLIILAGRPSMGKTALAVNICEAVAAKGKSVLLHSLEMSSSQLYDRRTAAIGGISLKRIKKGDLEQEDWDKFVGAVSTMKDRRFAIDDRSGLSIDSIRFSAESHKAKHGLDLLCVDYLQLLHVPGCENRTQEVAQISKGLKQIAKALKIPVIALSQLNRQSENRANKRPMMADLRESGAIEQDADIIAFVHRQEKYEPEDEQWRGVAEVITSKNRQGEIGTDYLTTDLEHSRFLPRYDQFAPKSAAPKTRAKGFQYSQD